MGMHRLDDVFEVTVGALQKKIRFTITGLTEPRLNARFASTGRSPRG
jgi:hypothetical protein